MCIGQTCRLRFQRLAAHSSLPSSNNKVQTNQCLSAKSKGCCEVAKLGYWNQNATMTISSALLSSVD